MKVLSRFVVPAFGLTFGLAALATLGCASEQARLDTARAAREQARKDRPTQIRAADDAPADSSPEMTVAGDEGTLNAADAEAAIEPHRHEFLDCYRLAARGQRPYGRVLLRFFVDGKGEVVDVSLLESTIGNGRVERCLADIAVGVSLPAPSGHRPMTFEYPLEFRSRPVTAERQKR